jgi:hypothetical protein
MHEDLRLKVNLKLKMQFENSINGRSDAAITNRELNLRSLTPPGLPFRGGDQLMSSVHGVTGPIK